MKTKIAVNEIVSLVSEVLQGYALTDSDISEITAHLLECELNGKPGHGFYRVPKIVRSLKTDTFSKGNITPVKETSFSCLLDGGGRLGLVVAKQATDTVICKALQTKIAIVGAYNYIDATGALAYYTKLIAENDLVGIAICNSIHDVAPLGSCEAILGTNPIAISIPTNSNPILVDLATSAWSYGALAMAMLENKQIPEGIVLDQHGNLSTNPHDADDGCMLPMAGHKGFGLGLVVEILAGPLVRAKAGKNAVPGSNGFTVVAFDPELFTPTEQFKSQVQLLIDEIKNSKRAPGTQEIYIPGEKSQNIRFANISAKYIEISDSVLKEIQLLLNTCS